MMRSILPSTAPHIKTPYGNRGHKQFLLADSKIITPVPFGNSKWGFVMRAWRRRWRREKPWELEEEEEEKSAVNRLHVNCSDFPSFQQGRPAFSFEWTKHFFFISSLLLSLQPLFFFFVKFSIGGSDSDMLTSSHSWLGGDSEKI